VSAPAAPGCPRCARARVRAREGVRSFHYLYTEFRCARTRDTAGAGGGIGGRLMGGQLAGQGLGIDRGNGGAKGSGRPGGDGASQDEHGQPGQPPWPRRETTQRDTSQCRAPVAGNQYIVRDLRPGVAGSCAALDGRARLCAFAPRPAGGPHALPPPGRVGLDRNRVVKGADIMSGKGGQENRREPRVSLSSEVDCEVNSAHVRWRFADLSAGGMFIDVYDPLPPGTRFGLRFQLEPPPISARAQVHYVQPRIGMVWDVRGNAKDVVRAGWGIYTDFGYTNSNVLFAAADASGSRFGTVFTATTRSRAGSRAL